MQNRPSQKSVKELLVSNDQYIIPMYQRNYAWEDAEISQLIQDISDNLPAEGESALNYYIGSLVVFQRKDTQSQQSLSEVIDGQQRLTTLILLSSYLRHRKTASLNIPVGKLSFDSRESSTHTIDTIQSINFAKDPELLLDSTKTNEAILHGYHLIDKILSKWNDQDLQFFSDFLFKKVQVISVKVPDDTELNHYFEIMNNRGEQLEKHEILKALLLRPLEDIHDPSAKATAKSCLHAVWEACANMEKYVQMGFPVSLRQKLFGSDWSSFTPNSTTSLLTFFEETNTITVDPNSQHSSPTGHTDDHSLESIIESATVFIEKGKNTNADAPAERFHPPINFQNFLLQVLRVFTKEDIPLDDKRLIPLFTEHLIKLGPEKVNQFTYALLKSKWLFDQYIIKRDYADGADDWSLKHLKKAKDSNSSYHRNTFMNADLNHRVLMLLTALHVSTPTMVYKHWLNAALHHLYQADGEIEAQSYLSYLEEVTKAFVFDRHLAVDERSDYYNIIYHNHGKCQTDPHSLSDIDLATKLEFQEIENNLIFNYLDYILWIKLKDSNSKKIKDFKFTFRSSVEHYYPQKPEKIPRLEPSDLDAFGNLCLISHSKNSRLSNFPPEAKKSDYQGKNTPIDSIKQHLMMEDTPPWNAEKIQAHTGMMIKTLKAGI